MKSCKKPISWFSALLMAASAALADIPDLLNIGPEERLGGGRLPAIATDSLNQPHVVADGNVRSQFHIYDRIGGSWTSLLYDVSQFNQSEQYFNPFVQIDENDTMFVSGILFGGTFGLGLIARENVAAQATPVTGMLPARLARVWDTGNLAIDPEQPGSVFASSTEGRFRRYVFNPAAGPTKLEAREEGQMYVGDAGEKSAFWISQAGPVRHPDGNVRSVFHGASGGWDQDPSRYQNSIRQQQGTNMGAVWASFAAHAISMGDDGTYVRVVSDNVDPEVAYITCDFSTGGKYGGTVGVAMNIWNGSGFNRPNNSLLILDQQGTSGLRRFAPQSAPAKDGGVYVVWTRGGRVRMRFVPPNAQSLADCGPEWDIAAGAMAAVDVDNDGNVHVAYHRNGGIFYRKLEMSGTGNVPVSITSADFDGDGRDDIAVFRPSTGQWFIYGSQMGYRVFTWGRSGDIPVPADYNGDGKAQLAVFRPSNGRWFIQGGSPEGIKFGRDGDLPIPGDYSGDGRADLAFYRTSDDPDSSNLWRIRRSSNGQVTSHNYGKPGDIPLAGDYRGDGRIDLAVFRPPQNVGDNTFFIQGRSPLAFGVPGDIPLVQDFDGDGSADIAVFRPGNGRWFWRPSGGGAVQFQTWGVATDIPLLGDFDGDGIADFAVYRPQTSRWFIAQSSGGNISDGTGLLGLPPITWGIPGDIPVAGHFDADGLKDFGIYRPGRGLWAISRSDSNAIIRNWGGPNDLPAAGDWNGDGLTDIAVFRPQTGQWFVAYTSGGNDSFTWGRSGDIPVPADYQHAGQLSPGVFRNGRWFIPTPDSPINWGVEGDIPLTGDFTGNGRVDLAVFRPSTGNWHLRIDEGDGLPPRAETISWGKEGDFPMVYDYNGDGQDNLIVWRPSTGKWHIRISSSQDVTITRGTSGDWPVLGDFDGDGTVSANIFRNGRWFILDSSTGRYRASPGPIEFGTRGDIPIGKAATR